MSDFKAKIHQIQVQLADSTGVAPDPLAGFQGLHLRQGRERGGECERRVVRRERKGGRESREGNPVRNHEKYPVSVHFYRLGVRAGGIGGSIPPLVNPGG